MLHLIRYHDIKNKWFRHDAKLPVPDGIIISYSDTQFLNVDPHFGGSSSFHLFDEDEEWQCLDSMNDFKLPGDEAIFPGQRIKIKI